MSRKTQLLNKIEERTAKVAVVGLGYVGLPLALVFAQAGFEVLGIEVNEDKVMAVNAGLSYVEDVPEVLLKPFVEKGSLRASVNYDDLADIDVIVICVPTPLSKTKSPDISCILHAIEEIARVGSQGKLIVLESTTYPGTTEEVIIPCLMQNGDRVGQDVFAAFSPERIDPGRTDYTIWTTPKVVGGMTPDCLEVALALYGAIVKEPVPVSTLITAEMTKLLENTFRAVNIALVNETALMCDRLGVDVWEVIEAAATKPYGFMKFTPGPGVGGHCIPLDPHYLAWKLKMVNYTAQFIDLASEINGRMPGFVAGKIADVLNNDRKAVNGSRILILGVAYKPDVGDTRESPALEIIRRLRKRGAAVAYHDPFVPHLVDEEFVLESVDLTPPILNTADCVVIVTNHRAFDCEMILDFSPLIVDTRNALKGMEGDGRVVTL